MKKTVTSTSVPGIVIEPMPRCAVLLLRGRSLDHRDAEFLVLAELAPEQDRADHDDNVHRATQPASTTDMPFRLIMVSAAAENS